MSAPTKVHGYPVLSSFETQAASCTRAGHVILVDRGGGDEYYHRYVTGWIGNGDREWCSGHYFNNRAEADEDYLFRCTRGY